VIDVRQGLTGVTRSPVANTPPRRSDGMLADLARPRLLKVKKFTKSSHSTSRAADADHAVAEMYGVWGRKSSPTATTWGNEAIHVRDRRRRIRVDPLVPPPK